MADSADFTEQVCNLLYQISQGEFDLEEEAIARVEAHDQQAVLTGLLMLHEDLEFRAEQRAEAEQELRRRQERQGALVDLAKVGIWDCDITVANVALASLGSDAADKIEEDDTWIYRLSDALTINAINTEGLRMIGASSVPELVERQGDLVTAESLPMFRAMWKALARGEQRVELQGKLKAFSGEVLHVVMGVTVPRKEEGFTIITLADVTAHHDRRQAERAAEETSEELARINTEVERLFYAVSHDLRAPLRAVQNLAEWAVEDLQAGEKDSVVEHLGALRGRVSRLERMMNDLLTYARVGRVERDVEDVDLGRMVEELSGFAGVPEGFEIVAGSTLPTIRTLRTLLTQVLLNLVGNAIKHHDKKNGRIEISAARAAEDGMIEVTVADDGPGIPNKYRERVFGLFRTLQSRDAVEGSGMGLAFVQKVVRSVGGHVSIVGPEDRGATFVFTWPSQLD